MSHRKVKVLVEVLVDTDLSELDEKAPQLWPEEQTEQLVHQVQKSLQEGNYQVTQSCLIPKDAHASNEDYSVYLVEPSCEFFIDPLQLT